MKKRLGLSYFFTSAANRCYSNLPPKERQALKDLANDVSIVVIGKADNSGAARFRNKASCFNEVINQLSTGWETGGRHGWD